MKEVPDEASMLLNDQTRVTQQQNMISTVVIGSVAGFNSDTRLSSAIGRKTSNASS